MLENSSCACRPVSSYTEGAMTDEVRARGADIHVYILQRDSVNLQILSKYVKSGISHKVEKEKSDPTTSNHPILQSLPY